jgi:predicted murein hydrolase (TIGR00659 family)
MFEGALIWLPCTLAIYAGSIALFRWGQKSPLLNPTLLTICGVALVLGLTGNSYRSYFEGVVILHYLLGPAVVALAVPLHRNLQRLEGRTVSMASALAVGSLTSILVGLAVAILAGVSASTLLSLAPKSATAAVSIEISRLIGGAPGVTATLTILTGIIGAVLGPYVLNLSGIRAPEARGFALGVASHGIATARAFTESEVAGSFAGLGMALNAVLTALAVPPIVRWLGIG